MAAAAAELSEEEVLEWEPEGEEAAKVAKKEKALLAVSVEMVVELVAA